MERFLTKWNLYGFLKMTKHADDKRRPIALKVIPCRTQYVLEYMQRIDSTIYQKICSEIRGETMSSMVRINVINQRECRKHCDYTYYHCHTKTFVGKCAWARMEAMVVANEIKRHRWASSKDRLIVIKALHHRMNDEILQVQNETAQSDIHHPNEN